MIPGLIRLLCFVAAGIRGAAPEDDHICTTYEDYVDFVPKLKLTPVKEYKKEWCFSIPPRCTKEITSYRHDYVMEEVVKSRAVQKCCQGYLKLKSGAGCLPVCSGLCLHGECVAPEKCSCESGYFGRRCDNPCTAGSWGPGCLKDCDCENDSNCDAVHGLCECSEGWQGVRCDVPCDAGHFGRGCELRCDCEDCDHVTGKCVGHVTEASTLTDTTTEELRSRETEEPEGSDMTETATEPRDRGGSGTSSEATFPRDRDGSGTSSEATEPRDRGGSGTSSEATEPRDSGGSGTSSEATFPRDSGGSGTSSEATFPRDRGGFGTSSEATEPRDSGGSGTSSEATEPRDSGGSGTSSEATFPREGNITEPADEDCSDTVSLMENLSAPCGIVGLVLLLVTGFVMVGHCRKMRKVSYSCSSGDRGLEEFAVPRSSSETAPQVKPVFDAFTCSTDMDLVIEKPRMMTFKPVRQGDRSLGERTSNRPAGGQTSVP